MSAALEMMFGSVNVLIAACCIMLVAQIVYTLFGFGAGLIAVGAMALLLPTVTDVVVLILLVCIPIEVFFVWKSRRDISWRGMPLIVLGVGVGVLVGTRILLLGEPVFILRGLAVVLLGAGIVFWMIPKEFVVRWPRWTEPIAGVLSGTLAGIFGIGGPPLILYFQLGGVPKTRFRGQLLTIFLCTAMVRLPTYGVSGLITGTRLVGALWLLPAALLGAWIGNRVHIEISEPRFRKLVGVAIGVIGVLLLLR